MKYDVFISYSTCDQKVADDICAYLEKNGIKCFIASRDIPAGVAFADYIVKALKESSMMVVVCSKNANVSEHIPREVGLASNEKKHILPFLIEDVPLAGNLQYYLVLNNQVKAFPKPEEHFEFLCQNVRKLLGIKKDNGPTDAVEQLRLGDKYAMTQDWAQAIKWYRKSSEQGNADAQFNLGWCYKNGYGVPKDLVQAVELYRRSAEQGNAAAQNNLGICYENGDVVPKDLVQAVELYRKSAEQGNAAAQNNLGVCYEYGAGVPENLEQAVELYRKSAEQGHPFGQFNLGVCYENGDVVPKDLSQAEYWYRESAEQGNVNARKALDRLTK